MAVKSNETALYGTTFAGLIGGLLVLFFDFGWIYNYDANVTYYIYFGSEIVEANLILPLIGLPLLWIGFVSIQAIQNKESLTRAKVKRMYQISLFVLAATIFAAIYLAIVGEEYADWDLVTGFYGGLVGSILSIIFSKRLEV